MAHSSECREAKRQELGRQRGLAKMEDVAQRAAAFQVCRRAWGRPSRCVCVAVGTHDIARRLSRSKQPVVSTQTRGADCASQAKEDEKLAGLRALLAKGPITIAKRT